MGNHRERPPLEASRTRQTTCLHSGGYVALSLTSLVAAAQSAYTYIAAEGTGPLLRLSFSEAADVDDNGEVVGTRFRCTRRCCRFASSRRSTGSRRSFR